MILRRTNAEDLTKVQSTDFTNDIAIDFFCKHPYRYLYVMDGDTVISVLRKNDIPVNEKLPSVNQYYVCQKTDRLFTQEEIEDVFQKEPGLSRLAVLLQDGELLAEFDDQSQPEEARNIEKNKMAMRYATLFSRPLENYFSSSGWKQILFIGDKTTYVEFSALFPHREIDYKESCKELDFSIYDVVFNFKYPIRYKRLCCSCVLGKVKEFYKIVEKVAFSKMVSYCRNRDIHFYLLRNPVYDRLTCLSAREEQGRLHRKSIRELFSDAEYMRCFAGDDTAEIAYLKTGNYRKSFLSDNGFIYQQSDVETPLLTVKNGRRRTTGQIANPVNTIYLFGTCITFGLYTKDQQTIASFLQESAYCQTNRLQVQNRGALLGRNLLNICMDVMNTPLADGDTVIIMDIFEDIPDDSSYGILDMNKWFNLYKPHSETWFLDFPLHCNAKANQLMARQMEELLKQQTQIGKDALDKWNYYTGKREDDVILLVLHKSIDSSSLAAILHTLTKDRHIRVQVVRDSEGLITRETELSLPVSCGHSVVVLHYGLGYDYHNFPPFDFFAEMPEDVTEDLLQRIQAFIQIRKKKILLYLGKFPADSSDIDGGSQLANQLIDSLKTHCCLDITFIRKEHETFADPMVHAIRYEEYIHPKDNKFSRRFDNIGTNRTAVLNGIEYDLILAGHCSKLFGLENDKAIMQKSIIFPMMLTSGYQRANETVPSLYTMMEEGVLRNVSGIITPSTEEYHDILTDYSEIAPEKIRIIPRGISPVIQGKVRTHAQKRLQIIAIGSFKKQKNHIAVLRVVEILKQMGIAEVCLTLVGAVHDHACYQEILSYTREHGLSDNVKIYSGISQKQLNEILKEMDISISCSRWETFGRGIFEGFVAGLPSVLSDSLRVVKKYAQGNAGVFFLSSEQEMAECIYKLYTTPDMFHKASQEVLKIGTRVSYYVERERLLMELLYRRFNLETPYDDWDLKFCKQLYAGRYSICYQNGKNVRKYFRYDNHAKVRAEFLAQKAAWEQGVPTPKPSFLSYDYENSMWYIQSEYNPVYPVLKKRLDGTFLADITMLLDFLQRVDCESLRSFREFLPEFFSALDRYADAYDTDVQKDKKVLRDQHPETFTHGDFLLKNLGLTERAGLRVFDFQNCCRGPRRWDLCYLLSEFSPENVDSCMVQSLTRADLELLCIVLKIRIGRAIRKGSDRKEMQERLASWERRKT